MLVRLFGSHSESFISLLVLLVASILQCRKKKGTAGKEIPFYSTLFGLESDVTVAHVITMLKKKVPDDPSLRIRYAVLALVDGYLLPTSHYPKIVKEHAEIGESIYFSQFSVGSFNL